jgi:hypothetical protein
MEDNDVCNEGMLTLGMLKRDEEDICKTNSNSLA